MKTIAAELKKSRRRYDGLVAVGIAVFVLLWCSVGKDTEETRATGYSALLYAVPVIHSVVMPLGMAVLASRCWDLESKAQNCRILFTIQSRSALFRGKCAVALLHLLALTLVEGVGFLLMGRLHGYTEPLDMGQFWWLMVCTLAVNAMLFFQALLLSIRFDSQVPTLAAGMLASLSGIFAGFMPPVVSYFLPWSYYIPLTAMTMDWTRQTRVVRYIPREFPLGLLAVCLVLGALSAWAAWQALKRKEV